jgi:hypothetical protein
MTVTAPMVIIAVMPQPMTFITRPFVRSPMTARIDPGDVYQTFFYAYGYSRQIDRDAGRTEALIIYPSSTGGPGAQLAVRPGAGIVADQGQPRNARRHPGRVSS